MNCNPKIYVAGHRGMAGSAIMRTLAKQGQTNIVVRTHNELDLTNQAAVRTGFCLLGFLLNSLTSPKAQGA